jgi:hypothetical protein
MDAVTPTRSQKNRGVWEDLEESRDRACRHGGEHEGADAVRERGVDPG